jgi:hypothetical protein
MMTNSTRQNIAEKNAQKYFKRADDSGTSAKRIRRMDRAADAAKTAKLRGLRIAKELADKEAAVAPAGDQAKNSGAEHGTPKRAAKTKRSAMVRMTY